MTLVRIFAALALMALAVPPAVAQSRPDRISFTLGSSHIGANRAFEELNPGVFLTWERRLHYSAGVFRNSFGQPSIAGTVALPVIRWPEGEASLFIGAAYYPGDGRRFTVSIGDVVPIGGLQLRHRNLFAQIIPSDGRAVAAIVSIGLTVPLH